MLGNRRRFVNVSDPVACDGPGPKRTIPMRRRVLPFLSILALGLVLSVRAGEPAQPQPPAKPAADFAVDQEILSRQFREFEKALLRLAQRLETSTKPEDRETAVKIK